MKLGTRTLALTLALTLAAGTAQAEQKDVVEAAVAAGSFNTLVAAVKAAGLVETLQGPGPFTVFAPSDEAFAKLPEGTVESLLKPENKEKLISILTYHVVAGKVPAEQVVKLTGANTVNGQRVTISTQAGVKVDQAQVVVTDIACSNGLIHVIDAVILPQDKSLVGVASEAGAFKTLLKAATAAGLAEVLDQQGPFTVFAPTDEAFAKLPEGTITDLLKPENKAQLAAVLKYHVVSGRVYSDAALKAGKAETLQGDAIKIAVKGDAALVNEAKLLKTDINAANGVIHVIDSVILPPTPTKKKEVSYQTPCQNTAPLTTVQMIHRR